MDILCVADTAIGTPGVYERPLVIYCYDCGGSIYPDSFRDLVEDGKLHPTPTPDMGREAVRAWLDQLVPLVRADWDHYTRLVWNDMHHGRCRHRAADVRGQWLDTDAEDGGYMITSRGEITYEEYIKLYLCSFWGD